MALMWRIIISALWLVALVSAQHERGFLRTVVDDDDAEQEQFLNAGVGVDEGEQGQVYIVYADATKKPPPYAHLHHWYDSLSPKIVYKYTNVLHGFAARLTPREAEALQNKSGILLVQPQLFHQLETTRTPQFLNLPANAIGADGGEDVIIGVLDTGIDPNVPSFGDAGIKTRPQPPRWNGSCTGGFTCNNKLIGAKYFNKGAPTPSPADGNGHGTHCASIAAGNSVPNATVVGYAPGTARGMANKAWLAVYKVCWPGCAGADILAGLDEAIGDGVDVLSMSLGSKAMSGQQLYHNNIYVGTLSAARKGIFVSSSAGNYGPNTVGKLAPWITTVASGTIDRQFRASVTIGDSSVNQQKFYGKSFSGGWVPQPTSLVYLSTSENTRLCRQLDPVQVRGKIVVCDIDSNESRLEKGRVVRDAGGSGMVLANAAQRGSSTVSEFHVLPAVHVNASAAREIRNYIAVSGPNAKASLECNITDLGVMQAPEAASTSSRGPNAVIPGLMKPDVMAPGVQILAAYPSNLPLAGPNESYDYRRSNFKIMSGTSMACPHVAGVAAVLKAKHPQWSEAAIRSALMTTAYVTARDGSPIQDLYYGGRRPATPDVYGAGYIDPDKANDPGLVYDLGSADYLKFVCSLGYTDAQVGALTGGYTCTPQDRLQSIGDLNYPSFVADFRGGTTSVTYSRSVTNVGEQALATYTFSGSMPSGVGVTVDPANLSFSQTGQTLTYQVTFTATSLDPSLKSMFGYLQWVDGVHVVRSPVAFVV